MTAEPPSVAGALHDSATDPLPPAAVRPCGADGTVAAACGVADASADFAETPTLLTAATV